MPASIPKARSLGLIIAPKPSHFPDFPNRSAAIDEAQHKSDALEIYQGLVRWQSAGPPAHTINFQAVADQYPDPRCTCLLMPRAAPFGTKVSIEVQFPRARFFNLQVTPSFLPGAYHNGYW